MNEKYKQMVRLATEGYDARKEGNEDEAGSLFIQLYNKASNNELLECSEDFIIGTAYWQMLYLDLGFDKISKKKIAQIGFFFISKFLKANPHNIDVIKNRVSLLIENEKLFIEILEESIEKAKRDSTNPEEILITPNDAYLLMLQFDFFLLGKYCHIIPSFSKKHVEITEMWADGHFEYIDYDLNPIGIGKRIQKLLYIFLGHELFKNLNPKRYRVLNIMRNFMDYTNQEIAVVELSELKNIESTINLDYLPPVFNSKGEKYIFDFNSKITQDIIVKAQNEEVVNINLIDFSRRKEAENGKFENRYYHKSVHFPVVNNAR